MKSLLKGLLGLAALALPGRKAQVAVTVAGAAVELLPDDKPAELVTVPGAVPLPSPSPSAPLVLLDGVVKPLVYSPQDFDTAWRTVWGEARGEGDAGMLAVAWCIRNRAELDLFSDGKPDWWGEGVGGVCLARRQYSCWDDHNRAKLLAVPGDSPVAVQAQAAVRAVLDGLVPDPTRNGAVSRLGGATHYYAPSLVPAPSWAKGRPRLCRIGGHDFYRVTD